MKEYIVDNRNNKMRYHDLPGKDVAILFIHMSEIIKLESDFLNQLNHKE